MSKKNRLPSPDQLGKMVSEAISNFQVKRIAVEPAQFVSLYVNDTQVQMTPWDFRLVLGLVAELPSAEDPTLVVKTIGEIRMSPQHIKRITEVLLGQLKVYEETYGPIPSTGVR